MFQTLTSLAYRGFKYGFVGGGTFLLDLSIVWVLTTLLALNYSIAIAIGFFIGVSVNFLISYRFVFSGTTQTQGRGYRNFLLIACGGAIAISLSTTFLVEYFALTLYIARIIVATVVGIGNFLINALFNFKVV